MTEKQGKGGKRRGIPINYGLTRLLKYGIKLPNTKYVFCNDTGKLFRNINRSCETAKRRRLL